MVLKRILFPDRLRRIPRQFSWVDHRLVRDKLICGLSLESLGLYLFLVTVSDADGLSYYSDTTVQQYLSMAGSIVAHARHELCAAGLIAYSCPLYQVLSLDTPTGSLPAVPCERPRVRESSEPVSLAHILRNAIGGKQ